MSHAVKESHPSADLSARNRIIAALDVDSGADARSIARELRGAVGAFKIGLRLYTAAGPDLVRQMVDDGHKIFLDLKFHDIPNTVAAASIEAAKLGVWMFNLHAIGGREMMETAVAAVDGSGLAHRPLMVAVTVLTSSDSATLSEVGISADIGEQVTRLAELAALSGVDGVVASPHEVATIRAGVDDPAFLVVTPGIRPNSGTHDDQKRVTTVGGAFANGSDFIVIGRPIIEAPDRLAAVEHLLADQ